ncbi:hemolysin family protein [candidate division KSB1 bacterium]
MTFSIIILGILLLFSAFFSGAEIAVMSLSELRVRHLVEMKKRNARLLRRLKSNTHKLLITILVGNNLANIGAASYATTVSITFLQQFELNNVTSLGIGVTTGLMTLLILIFGEITPKAYCITHAEAVALKITPVLQFFEWLFSPLVWFLKFFTRLTSKVYLSKRYPLVTEDEVRTIVKIGEEEGAIQQEEKEMIHNVFELDNTEVSSVMTPRVDMFVLESTLTIQEAVKKIQDKVYSRIPVFEENIDRIIGIAHAKDILHAALSGKGESALGEIVRPAIFIPNSMMINVLLHHFKKQKTHIALVIDEHGGIAGLVTIEDVLEEIVGEIYDETDKPELLISPIDSDTYKIAAKINIGDLNEMLELDLNEHESFETLSGLILHQLGQIPQEGDVVHIDNITLRVSKIEEHRIVEVVLTKNPAGSGPETSSASEENTGLY